MLAVGPRPRRCRSRSGPAVDPDRRSPMLLAPVVGVIVGELGFARPIAFELDPIELLHTLVGVGLHEHLHLRVGDPVEVESVASIIGRRLRQVHGQT